MTAGTTQNPFLPKLLALQQDGSDAISAPSNWTRKPLLEVRTYVDKIVEMLEQSILKADCAEIARWHFFIGSPGNGKSAAMGKLYRQLLSARECVMRDEQNKDIASLPPAEVPYAIHVYEQDNKFATVHIVQDASVVRNPYAPDVDPAVDLLDTLEKAWNAGVSLIVCTNRGVLEKAHRDKHLDNSVNSKPWFKILSSVVSAQPTLGGKSNNRETWTFDAKKPAFSKATVDYTHLDDGSFFLGNDTFNDLLASAIDEKHWAICSSCPAVRMCPFKTNRDWLANDAQRKNIVQLLKRAEVLSGQAVVFREALALISLILAGCPGDYGEKHPCKWVQDLTVENDVFSLAARRIYICLFAPYAPHGLEVDNALRQRQINVFTRLSNQMSSASNASRNALLSVIEFQHPSTDVGITRFLGSTGVLRQLDPCMDDLSSEFYDRWDADFDVAKTSGGSMFTEIENTCISVWREMEERLELLSEYQPEGRWALRRWSSNFLLHFGAILEGRSAWANDLDEFVRYLELAEKEDQTTGEKREMRKLDTQLDHLLNATRGNKNEATVQLSEVVKLRGQWVENKLKPKTVSHAESGSVSLAIEFGTEDKKELSVFAAPMYLWLSRRTKGKLDERCFPQELLAGARDARIRAASKGEYAFVDNEVELEVTADTDKMRFLLVRIDGEVEVDSCE